MDKTGFMLLLVPLIDHFQRVKTPRPFFPHAFSAMNAPRRHFPQLTLLKLANFCVVLHKIHQLFLSWLTLSIDFALIGRDI